MAPSVPSSLSENHGPKTPWWSKRLAFSCTSCGKCCHARGQTIYVYVNQAEREELATFLNLSLEQFETQHTEINKDGDFVLQFDGNRCRFLKNNQCEVHAVKPTQCRTWPFWEENLTSKETWVREVAEFCPGEGKGPIRTDEDILCQVEETEMSLRLR